MHTTTFEAEEEKVAWEGLASSCASPVKRLGAFALLGFVFFVAAITAVIFFYSVFGERFVPQMAFYVTLGLSIFGTLAGYAVWLAKSLRSYAAFSSMLRRGGLDPRRPTLEGLRAYSDDQLLALRSRYERTTRAKRRELLDRMFGFYADDSFSLGPLSALPGTFEMNALRVDWETNLILRAAEPMPEVSWWIGSSKGFLPRQPDEFRRLVYALRYTNDSVRELKRQYGYRTDRWHATVPEGKLWDAVRDLEDARRIQATLTRRGHG